MRPLYEINADLEAVLNKVDPETGEVMIDPDALNDLLMERTEKLEGVALYIKDIDAEITALKTEEAALAERRKVLEKKRAGLWFYLQQALSGEKFETPRVSISYRKSKSVKIDNDVFWQAVKRFPAYMDKYLRHTSPEIDKKAVGDALKAGNEVYGASFAENVTMNIK